MGTSLNTIDVKANDSKLALLVAESHALVITDKPSCEAGRVLQKRISDYMKGIGFEFDEGIAKAQASLDHQKSRKAKWHDPAKAEYDALRTRCDEWSAEERRQAQAEQDATNARLKREQDEKAEQIRIDGEKQAREDKKIRLENIMKMYRRNEISAPQAQRLIKLARAEGAVAKQTAAALAEETRNAPPPRVEVKPDLPHVPGVPNRINFYAEMADWPKFLAEYRRAVRAHNTIRIVFLEQFIEANEQAIGKYARDTKSNALTELHIPGVRATSRG